MNLGIQIQKFSQQKQKKKKKRKLWYEEIP